MINPPYKHTGRRLMEAAGTILAQSWSPDDQRLAAVEWSPDSTSTRVHLIEVKTGKVETLPQPAGEPALRPRASRWSVDGGSLYWLTDFHSEFMYLAASYDLATRTETRLGRDPLGHRPLCRLLRREHGRARRERGRLDPAAHHRSPHR